MLAGDVRCATYTVFSTAHNYLEMGMQYNVEMGAVHDRGQERLVLAAAGGCGSCLRGSYDPHRARRAQDDVVLSMVKKFDLP